MSTNAEPWQDMLTEHRRPGIYQITLQGRIYVGSAVRIDVRWRAHRNDLNRGKHHSRLLQRTFNKYGLSAAVFEVLEYVDDPERLIDREQFWLDKLRPYDGGYNTCPNAHSVLGLKHPDESRARMSLVRKGMGAGKRISPEQREKIAESLRGRKHSAKRKLATSKAHIGIRQSEESKAKISAAMKGVPKSPEVRARMSDAQKESWAKRRAQNV